MATIMEQRGYKRRPSFSAAARRVLTSSLTVSHRFSRIEANIVAYA